MEESGAEMQSLLASITGTDIRNAIPVQNIERGGRKEPDLVELLPDRAGHFIHGLAKKDNAPSVLNCCWLLGKKIKGLGIEENSMCTELNCPDFLRM